MASTSRNWHNADAEELDMRWESYLNGKRDDVRKKLSHNTIQIIHLEDREDETRGEDPVAESRDDVRDSPIDPPTADFQQGFQEFPAYGMLQYLEKRNWKALMNHITSNPQAAFVRMTWGANGLSISTKGNLMLHEVCKNEPPLELVEVLLASNESAIKTTGEFGRLPLHFACASGASGSVVQRLIEAFPGASKVRDGGDLMLPLHLACKWGASEAVFKAVIAAHPDARRMRDIYAKTPADYARSLVSPEDRRIALGCLAVDTSAQAHINEIKASSKENETLADLKKENLAMEGKFDSMSIKATQAKQLKALEQEFKSLQFLQNTNEQKKALLEKKLEVLVKANEVKQQLIERLEQENDVKYNIDLKNALKNQENKYKQLLKTEQDKVGDLERRAKEIEITHRLYTNAILEEHERESADFEVFTLQFQELEAELRSQLEETIEKNNFLELDVKEKSKKFDEIINGEKEKVSFLEEHVFKVNGLLESEQKRFQELEEILKQTITAEHEQREEMIAEFSKKEQQYKNLLSAEKNKVIALEEDYTEIRDLLREELDKVAEVEQRESALQGLVDKGREVLENRDERQAVLAEKEKVTALEAKLEEVQKELEVERALVDELRSALQAKQEELEAERKKVKSLQKTQAHKRQVLDSLHQKVAVLEAAVSESKNVHSQESVRFESAMRELEHMKRILADERKAVEELAASKQELTDLLNIEKRKVMNLEEAQVVTETEMEIGLEGESEAFRNKLMENQKLLNVERARVSNLKEEQAQLNKMLGDKEGKMFAISEQLSEKETVIATEKRKIGVLRKRQTETEARLNSEKKRVHQLEEEQRIIKTQLEAEQNNVEVLERSLAEATNQVEMVEVRLNTPSHADSGLYRSFSTVEKRRVLELERALAMHKDQLEAEQDLVQELEIELSEARALCKVEMQKVLELREHNKKVVAEIRAENDDPEAMARKDAIIESEQNKVKALEHARDQLQALLDWEKNNLQLQREKHSEVEMKLKEAEEEMSNANITLLEKDETVGQLSEKLESLGALKKEVVRLNAQARQRDLMLASVLKTIGDDNELSKELAIQEAQVHVDDLQSIIGLDLAGLDDAAIVANGEGGALICASRRDMTAFRRIRRTLVWTIPLIPIIAITQDPSIVQDLTANLDPQMLHDMTANFAAMASNFDPAMIRDLTRDLAANLADNFDASVIQEPIAQMLGMASQLAASATDALK